MKILIVAASLSKQPSIYSYYSHVVEDTVDEVEALQGSIQDYVITCDIYDYDKIYYNLIQDTTDTLTKAYSFYSSPSIRVVDRTGFGRGGSPG